MGFAALAYALATLVLAYPALSGQFLVNPHSDQYIAGFAFRDFATQALRAGQSIPHWNPYMFGGLPYIAAMHGDIFYPTALLRLLIGTDAGMTWGFIIHTFLAGLFTYGFLRAWGLGFVASLVGGLAYMLSGPIASYASPGHDGKLFVSALLPLALWLLIRGVRDGRLYAWGAFAITIGLALLSPHPQLLQYLLLTSGAFALFLALGTDAAGVKLDRRTAVRRLAFALAAVVVGMAIGAIQYLPVREYVAWSPRAAGHDYATATSYSFPSSSCSTSTCRNSAAYSTSTGARTGFTCTASTSADPYCCSPRRHSAAMRGVPSGASGSPPASLRSSGCSAGALRSFS